MTTTKLLLPPLLLFAAGGTARAQFLEPGTTVLHTLSGETPGELFGAVIADLDDLDDDGITDVAIAATQADGFTGRVDVFSGRTGERLHRIPGPVAGTQLGYSLADAGDVNRDGVPDLIAGAPGGGTGRAFVFSGADGTLLFPLAGELPGDRFGVSVGGPGDVDGDHVPDLLVGAPAANGRTGRVYLISGKSHAVIRTFDGDGPNNFFGSGLAGIGDLDGDRRGDFIAGARNAGPTFGGLAYVFSGKTGQRLLPPLTPAPSAGEFGSFFVATPGDVDGDGRQDLYVGDFSDGADFSGRAYVFSGRDGHELYQFPGPPAGGAGCGRGARDVDGDRRADIIVGAYSASEGAPLSGQATVYSGCTGAPLRTFTGAVENERIGFDSVGIGDTNDDHEADFLISGATADHVYIVAGARTCLADFDHDGRTNGRDAAAFLLALVRRDPRADTNCDARVDLLDYLGYLRAVLVGCG